MRLSRLRLNRTLLARQHLLRRSPTTAHAMVEHLVGLQAQEPLSPYLSLAARLEEPDPWAVSAALTDRTLARVLSLRGTVHLHTPGDALALPVWARPVREREMRVSQSIGSARQVDRDAFAAAVRDVLAEGPLSQRALGAALAERFGGYTAAQLGQVARVAEVLVQLPPRGCWKPTTSTAVTYDFAERWLGAPLTEPDVPTLVRRYLRAFGPSSATDVTAWSGLTRLGPVLAGMADLVQHEDADGRRLYDVADAPIAEEDDPAPVRLLGLYDNVWLAHAGRDRVTSREARAGAAGPNGARLMSVLVDGWATGFWQVREGRVVVEGLMRTLTRTERDELDAEVARTEALLAR